MESINKVLVAIPSGDQMQSRFVNSLIGLLGRQLPHTTFFYANWISSRIADNRNELAKLALEKGHTHVLYIDADMVVPLDGIERLLNHDKDIVGASACKRIDGQSDVIGIPLHPDDAITTLKDDPLVEMQSMGLPFMLIKTDVFKKLGIPWFAEPYDENGILIPEDTFFCQKVRQAGYKIWCDMPLTACMGHLGIKEYKPKPLEVSSYLRAVA